MINVPGRLTVRTIHGRNGPFNVGRLATSIGEFVIKDSQLDQFQEGQFSGQFLILEIRPASYFAGGRLVVEVRAKVGEMMLADNGELMSQSGPHFDSAELDPLEEEASSQPSSTSPVSPQPQPSSAKPTPEKKPFGAESQATTQAASQEAPTAPQADTDADPDAHLFGLLWPLGDSVHLDPTIERAVFRRQVQRLKELGYQFQSRTQTWHK